MRRYLQIFCVAVMLFAVLPMEQPAAAIDPITMAILAPIALRVAGDAAPYVYRGAVNAGRCLLKMGKDTLGIFYIPFGLGMMCFGRARRGMVYVIRGGIAPVKLILHTLMFPVALCGVNFNF